MHAIYYKDGLKRLKLKINVSNARIMMLMFSFFTYI